MLLPITDPYVVHHGALGSFATVYLPPAVDVAQVTARLRAVRGIEYVGTRTEASRAFELPADRIGNLVVISDHGTMLGRPQQNTT